MKTIRLRGEDYTRYMQNLNNARHEIKKSYFDEFGPVRFTSPSGRFIAVVRSDPGEMDAQSSVETSSESETVSEATMDAQAKSIKRQRNSGLMQRAPKPRACKCKDWPMPEGQGREVDAGGKPTAHHPKCAWAKMYERMTGNAIVNVPAGPTLEPKIHRAGKIVNTAKVVPHALGNPGKSERTKPKVSGVPRPESCAKCKDFTKNKASLREEAELGIVQHHPTCEHYKKYKALSLAQKATGVKPAPVVKESPKDKVMLWDLTTQDVVRKAEPDEIEEARARLRDEAVALCEVDGNQYLVAYESGESIEPADPLPPSAEEDPAQSDTEPPGPIASEEPEAGEGQAGLLGLGT